MVRGEELPRVNTDAAPRVTCLILAAAPTLNKYSSYGFRIVAANRRHFDLDHICQAAPWTQLWASPRYHPIHYYLSPRPREQSRGGLGRNCSLSPEQLVSGEQEIGALPSYVRLASLTPHEDPLSWFGSPDYFSAPPPFSNIPPASRTLHCYDACSRRFSSRWSLPALLVALLVHCRTIAQILDSKARRTFIAAGLDLEGSPYPDAGMKGRGETGDPRENPPTNGIVRHDSHMRKSGVTCRGLNPDRLGVLIKANTDEVGDESPQVVRLEGRHTVHPPALQLYSDDGVVIRGRGKRECPEKTRRSAASPGTIPTCENPGVTRPGIAHLPPRRTGFSLTAQPPRPLECFLSVHFAIRQCDKAVLSYAGELENSAVEAPRTYSSPRAYVVRGRRCRTRKQAAYVVTRREGSGSPSTQTPGVARATWNAAPSPRPRDEAGGWASRSRQSREVRRVIRVGDHVVSSAALLAAASTQWWPASISPHQSISAHRVY
ncbi:hypothetical protein PR048_026149 [Dryococelus australis]|uniref:Uncharacterized protein n=1 Tax=Dryococelus australis TaxID=614101 RepID=A0ABQ9GKL4_9NEOP|nr:hypothetical protein PR048_026149 [Dryococelus australis]